ncbi:hypothetical protein D018_1819B, partial [Vibrio parahaemolyticus VP2007-007]
VTMQMPHQ